MTRFHPLLLAAVVAVCAPLAPAGNPLIPTVFSADPSAHVWPGDDRIWVYASHDEPGTNTHDTMISYHVFSSRDLVNWTDHGIALHLYNVDWAISHMWAIDAVYRHGQYHLVYCAKRQGDGSFRTGLAVSARPEGPFRDIGYIEGVEHGQDPALFVDDDDTPYLFWGSGGRCHAVQLTDDLRAAVPGTQVELTDQLPDIFEGPWVHRQGGKYVLSYPGLPGGQWPEVMYYATADQPLGPYAPQGVYLPEFEGRSGTNHGSIIHYQGKWIAFYHAAWLSGGLSEVRNLMADELIVNPDGSYQPLIPTHRGVAVPGAEPGPSRVTVRLEAENGPDSLGRLRHVVVADEIPGFTGAGYVEGFHAPGNAVLVTAQSAMDRPARLKVRYRSPLATEPHKVRVNHELLPDPVHGHRTWEKFVDFPQAKEWTEIDLGPVRLREGDNVLQVYAGPGGALQVDCFILEPLP